MTTLAAADDRPRRLVTWLETLLWIASIAILAFALVVAAAQLVAWVKPAVHGARLSIGAAAEIAVVAVAGLVVLGIGLWLEHRGRWRLAIGVGIVALVGLRLLSIAVFPSPITSDWAVYVSIAQRMLTGEGFWSARPPGWPLVLAGAFALLGSTPLSGELADVLFSIVAGLVMVALVAPAFGRRAALLGLFGYALLPSSVLWTIVLGVETLYASSLVVLAALAVLAVRRWRWALVVAILVGAGFGLAQYVKPSSQIYLPVLLTFPVLAGLGWRRAAAVVVAMAVTFAVVVTPILAWNANANGRVSVSPYLYDGWILYVGLSLKYDGQFNHEDDGNVWIATGLSTDGSTPPQAQHFIAGPAADPFSPTLLAYQRVYDETAGRLGIQRLESNGLQTIPLAVKKAGILWGRDDQPVTWIYRGRESEPDVAARYMLRELSQVGWVVILLGALLAPILLLRRTGLRRRGPPRPLEMTVVFLLLVATAGLHVLAQVNPRFHEYLVPLLCALAGIGFAELWRWVDARRGGGAPAGTPPMATAG